MAFECSGEETWKSNENSVRKMMKTHRGDTVTVVVCLRRNESGSAMKTRLPKQSFQWHGKFLVGPCC